MTIRVIGLGQTLAGDDGVGLLVLDELEREPPPGVELHRVSDAAALVELVQGAQRVVIVDAAVGAGAPGTVRTLQAEALADGEIAPVSTHGIAVGQALELARVLAGGDLAPTAIVAVAIEPPRGYVTELTPAVRAAIPRAVRAVLDLTRSSAMHESALARSVLDAVLDLARKNGATRVRRVVGQLSETEHLHAESIQFHFTAHAVGTPAEAAHLELDLVHVPARCRACAETYPPEHHVTLCPRCGSTDAELLGAVGLRIDSLDVE